MPRNLYERVEVLFPVREPMLQYRIRHEILEAYLRDNVKARIMQRDGTYTRPHYKGRRSLGGFSAQQFLMDVAEGKANMDDIPSEAPAVRRSRSKVREGNTR